MVDHLHHHHRSGYKSITEQSTFKSNARLHCDSVGSTAGTRMVDGLNRDPVRSRYIGSSTHIESEYIGLTGQGFLSEDRSNPLVGADTYLNIFLWFLAAPRYYRMRSYLYWARFLHRCLIKIGYRKSGVDFRQE